MKRKEVERLADAGKAAPGLRRNVATDSARRVHITRNGEVVRHASLAEVKKGICKLAEIELAVPEGKRPKKTVCAQCGRVFENVRHTGRVPNRWRCDGCSRVRVCVDCGDVRHYARSKLRIAARCDACARRVAALARKPGRSAAACAHCRTPLPDRATEPNQFARRHGAPAVCGDCTKRHRRTSRLITLGGETRTLAEWAERIGVSTTCLAYRIRIGCSNEAIMAPSRRKRGSK